MAEFATKNSALKRQRGKLSVLVSTSFQISFPHPPFAQRADIPKKIFTGIIDWMLKFEPPDAQRATSGPTGRESTSFEFQVNVVG